MTLNRRRLFAAFAGVAGATTPAMARESEAPIAEIDAVALGLRPNAGHGLQQAADGERRAAVEIGRTDKEKPRLLRLRRGFVRRRRCLRGSTQRRLKPTGHLLAGNSKRKLGITA